MFQKGDIVRLILLDEQDQDRGLFIGSRGTVLEVDSDGLVLIDFIGTPVEHYVLPMQLEYITRKDFV